MITTCAPRMAYLPGSTRFTYRAQERRTEHYRTWRGQGDMGWCWECLDCGDWASSQDTRADAIRRAAVSHPDWCHVAQGCHCDQPHITAAQAARLGLAGESYPWRLGTVLLRMAGGKRRHCPPVPDRYGTPHGTCYCTECAA